MYELDIVQPFINPTTSKVEKAVCCCHTYFYFISKKMS